MKSLTIKALVLAVAAGSTHMAQAADTIAEALKETKASGAFNLRYEDVDNSALTSDGLTLRSRITLTTGSVNNFSAVVGFEDVRDILGIDDEGGLIPDPEVTEVDQAFIQYKAGDATLKLGRQMIALDNQRYVGHVGWRQDRQTFDALRYTHKVSDTFNVDLSYVYKYNRIFAETADFDADTFLLNAAYTTSIGKLTGYAYLLDNNDNDAAANNSDTYGLRFTGSTKGDTKFLYTAEYAMQSADDFDADYILLEGGVTFSGVTAKLGYEVRESDEGAYGFATPLATGHAFNGWTDVYLAPGNDGLEDLYVSLAGKAGPVSLIARYHDYDSDEGSTDKGSEIEFQASMKLGAGVTGALKYASYSQGDVGTVADRDKLWLSFGYSF